MKPLRALHLVHDSPRINDGCGGTERYVHALASATGDPVFTRDRNHDGPLKCLNEGPYPLWIWPETGPKSPRFRDHFSIPSVAAALDKVLSECKIDLVHIHHLAHLGFGLPQVAQARGLPVLFHLHDYQSICVRGQLVDRDLQRCKGPEAAACTRCVLEHVRARPSLHFMGRIAHRLGIHHQARELVAKGRPRASEVQPIQERFEATREAMAAVDRFLSPSRNLADRMISLGWIPKESAFVEDLPLVRPIATKPKSPQSPFRILFVGSLIPTKGPQVLLQAAAGLNAEVHFYGPAPIFDGHPDWGQKLIAKIQGQEGAHYGGVFNDDERDNVYGSADLFVMPSIWEENSPLVLREALAAGLPTLISNVGGMSEIAPHSALFAAGSVSDLRKKLQEAISVSAPKSEPKNWPMAAHIQALQMHYKGLAEDRFDPRQADVI